MSEDYIPYILMISSIIFIVIYVIRLNRSKSKNNFYCKYSDKSNCDRQCEYCKGNLIK